IGNLCTCCVVRVEHGGKSDTYAAGTLCPDPSAGSDAPCTTDSLFDLASLTKLATTALLLSFVRERQLTLDTPLRELIADFRDGGGPRVAAQTPARRGPRRELFRGRRCGRTCRPLRHRGRCRGSRSRLP